MKSIVIILTILYCSVSFAEHNKYSIKTVESVGEAVLTGNKSIEQVKEEALNNARKEAVELVSGVEISSNSLTKDSSIYYSFINMKAKGRIVKEEIKEWKEIKSGTDKDGIPINVYRVKIKADVKEESDFKKDTLFSIKAEINKNSFINGEKAEIKIFATRKSYITVFNFYEKNSADIIFPNEFEKTGEILENGYLYYPSKGTSFELYCPEGKKESKEIFYVVALKEFVDFRKMLGEKTTIEEVNRVIADIDDKAEYMMGYVVRD